MSEYKRLTNNNRDEYDPEYDFCIGCKYFGEPNGCNRPNGTCSNYERFIETYNRLAELEDKIESGQYVELPCKVGDRFYEIDTLYCEYRNHEVSGFTVENGELILIDCYFNGYKVSEVCFSKAEAELRLKELQEKRNEQSEVKTGD